MTGPTNADDGQPTDHEGTDALRRAIATVTDPGRRRTFDGTFADFAALAKLADALHQPTPHVAGQEQPRP